jgi:hypothetical protein
MCASISQPSYARRPRPTSPDEKRPDGIGIGIGIGDGIGDGIGIGIGDGIGIGIGIGIGDGDGDGIGIGIGIGMQRRQTAPAGPRSSPHNGIQPDPRPSTPPSHWPV